MAREQLETLTQPMYYTLLALKEARNGAEIAAFVQKLTDRRVSLPPGTLYSLLAIFTEEAWIERIDSEGPGKKYRITKYGLERLERENLRLREMLKDYVLVIGDLD